MLTDLQLRQISPRLAAAKLQLYLPHLNKAMQTYGVDTMQRTAAFIAQLAHESGEFRWMEEIWGPTDPQRRYEPPGTLAARLGNTQPGDGKRFKGRGPIQITGRFNYAKYGTLLGVDLAAQPELAATPEFAFATAGLYWQSNGLNELADSGDFVKITRRINGGTNGLPDRQKYYALALGVLATGFVPNPALRGARRKASVVSEPLQRGQEAIRRIRAARPVAAKAPVTKAAARTR
ncbi:MAG: glycoside hydrolase family 19 protein [Burkholderiales bacterium]